MSAFRSKQLKKLAFWISECRQPVAINETYFIEANLDNKGKFERIKKALITFDCEDELIIKSKD
ncbi:hypothetical protein [Okeania sp. SIO3I5]|uniref:hypothetical protein n=1 Tax=Okeania sp. SIO3I5 TaxID=2607805 RepID=UPI0025ECB350|nr:hypothetical protein [Okeania sp. SIO3I5]